MRDRASCRGELARGHDASYIAQVESGELSRRELLSLGLPWSPELVERARRSVGATLLAAEAALEDGRGCEPGRRHPPRLLRRRRGLLRLQRRGLAEASPAARGARAPGAGRRSGRAPGRRHARGAPRRPRRLHALRQRVRELPVQARSRRHRRSISRTGQATSRIWRPLPGSCRRRSRGPGRSSASTSPAPTRTKATASGALRCRGRGWSERDRLVREALDNAGVPICLALAGGLRRSDRGHGGDQPRHLRVLRSEGRRHHRGLERDRCGACAQARRDARLPLRARRPRRASASSVSPREVGGEAEVCDVGDRAAVEDLAASDRRAASPCRLLVNNAGVSGPSRLPRARAGADRGGHAHQLPRRASGA